MFFNSSTGKRGNPLYSKTISKHVFICFINIFVFTLFTFNCHANTYGDEKSDVVISNTTVSVDSGASICVTSDVSITEDGKFINSGKFWVANSLPAELSFVSQNSGKGKFIFSGSSDCTLSCETTCNKVLMKTNGGTLLLEGNLTIEDSLALESGIINTGTASLLFQNDLPNSLVFNNTKESNSYIQGSFIRTIAANKTYYFPVGEGNDFHPFLIQEATTDANIEVIYDPNISQEWKMDLQNTSFRIEDIGGWKVNSDIDFYPGLSLCDGKDSISIKNGTTYSILYATNELSYSNNYKKRRTTTEGNLYLLGLQKSTGGIYTVATEEELKLVNFIYDSGEGDNYFEIPDISKYSKVELTVYNRWGQKVFSDPNYYNNFDCSNFPQGTYFYELKLQQEEAVKKIRNFIEIKRD